jgi:hypothetical protein
MTRIAIVLAAALACSVSASAQQGRNDASFVWSRRIHPGSTLTIRNANGSIHVSESTSDRVELRAEKRPRGRASVRDVAFDVDESDDRVTVCTLYDRQTSCRGSNRSGQSSSMRVDYVVLVPLDVRVNLSTGTGEIVAEHRGASVDAATGNGRVFVTTSRGPVSVSTGNGDVDVRVGSATDADVNVVSGSGLIRVTVPSDFAGQVEAQSGNGTLRSDFDITVVGRLDANHVRGTIGHGSSRIHLLTGNGRIELRKG